MTSKPVVASVQGENVSTVGILYEAVHDKAVHGEGAGAWSGATSIRKRVDQALALVVIVTKPVGAGAILPPMSEEALPRSLPMLGVVGLGIGAEEVAAAWDP